MRTHGGSSSESDLRSGYTAGSEKEAAEIMKIAGGVRKHGVAQAKQVDRRILFNGEADWYNFGIIACSVKYGKNIFN